MRSLTLHERYYYPATLLTDARTPAFTEEIFGPVLCLTPFDTLDQNFTSQPKVFLVYALLFLRNLLSKQKKSHPSLKPEHAPSIP